MCSRRMKCEIFCDSGITSTGVIYSPHSVDNNFNSTLWQQNRMCMKPKNMKCVWRDIKKRTSIAGCPFTLLPNHDRSRSTQNLLRNFWSFKFFHFIPSPLSTLMQSMYFLKVKKLLRRVVTLQLALHIARSMSSNRELLHISKACCLSFVLPLYWRATHSLMPLWGSDNWP